MDNTAPNQRGSLAGFFPKREVGETNTQSARSPISIEKTEMLENIHASKTTSCLSLADTIHNIHRQQIRYQTHPQYWKLDPRLMGWGAHPPPTRSQSCNFKKELISGNLPLWGGPHTCGGRTAIGVAPYRSDVNFQADRSYHSSFRWNRMQQKKKWEWRGKK